MTNSKKKSKSKKKMKISTRELINALKSKEDLDKIFDNDDYLLKVMIIKILGAKEVHESVDLLMKLLNDDNLVIRLAAIEALGNIKSKKAVPELIKLLDDDDSNVRAYAVIALGEIEDKLAFESLLLRLYDPNSTVREYAVQSLSKVGDDRLIDYLKMALQDPDQNVLWATSKAISENQKSKMTKNVILDISLFLDIKRLEKTFELIKNLSKEFKFYVPHTFYNLIEKEEEMYNISKFFDFDKDITPELLRKLKENKKYIHPYEKLNEKQYDLYEYFFESLSNEQKDKNIRNIIFEEWVALQQFSWVISNKKDIFELFKEYGAISIEISENIINKIKVKIGKKEKDTLFSNFSKLRAFGKFIALSVNSSNDFLSNHLITDPNYREIFHAAIIFGIGLFLLLDPEDNLET